MNPHDVKILELESRIDDIESQMSFLDSSEEPEELDDLLVYQSDMKAQLKSLTGEGYEFKIPTLEDCVQAIDTPLDEWPGRCHEVAIAVGEALSLPGKAQYGLYFGEIHEKSVFFGRPLTRHGWWILDDGRILDPTRWTLDFPEEPYLHCGEDWDHEYDFGGNRLRAANQTGPPDLSADETRVTFTLSLRAACALHILCGEKTVHEKGGKIVLNKHQLFWLANTPLGYLQDPFGWDFTWEVYQQFEEHSHATMIPIDNFNEVMGTREKTPS